MRSELLRHGDYNVIIVDWAGGSLPLYTQATANTRLVGLEIAHLVKHLQVIIYPAIFDLPRLIAANCG
jgi:pancreatic triacylglycerol lipase